MQSAAGLGYIESAVQGVQLVVQVTLILGSALLFWMARTPSSESSYSGYGAF